MDPVTFWSRFPVFLGIGGIAFSCGMFWYFLKYGRRADDANKMSGKINYSSITLSSILVLGTLICFIYSLVILISGILALLCD